MLRIFPRYDMAKANIEVSLINGPLDTLALRNVGLGGFSIEGPKEKLKFDEHDLYKFSLNLKSRSFTVTACLVWTKDQNYGFRFIFDETEEYRSWVTFMSALHKRKNS